ncbi:MAG TPA: metallophosphoesterase [Stackebrandtia sp.]|uniref:metallophosphoesterase family protein n=1 Tax=Stackebrandtia sp. TaxID=2023065 RepID=UPI002D4ACA37|nr:metallophosphoesterase [Stackebrandtia sp.]HZE39202.1 metallophosphoesterase [Stackebrandtia sp.]
MSVANLASLGPIERLEAAPRRLLLAGPGDSAGLRLVAWSAAGFRAPVGRDDIAIDLDPSVLSIDAHPAGLRVTARADDVSTTVAIRLGESRAEVAVAVGSRPEVVAEPARNWRVDAARAAGGLDGPRLDYDFTRSSDNRAVYAAPPRRLPIPGQPRRLSMWIDGDGRGAWPTLHCLDADGTDLALRSEHLEWEGWREIDFVVPDTAAYPLRLRRFYLAETRPAERYRGAVTLGTITAHVPPEVDIPPEPVSRPLERERLDDFDWRFAVLSDTQFVAAEPEDRLVDAARIMLRDISSRDCEFVLINGDFVDDGGAASLELAHGVLETELADGPPWIYVPGNHEIAGGDIAAFRARFGPARVVRDHRRTRLITLDTSSLSIGADQLSWLSAQLDAAAAADHIDAALVATHVPPHDPTGHGASQLCDPAEARALERMLAAFARDAAKGCCLVAGHAGVFAHWLRDGVAYVVNGNSGKTPAAPERRGGVLGWTEIGVRAHRGRPDWLGLRVRRPDVTQITGS